MTILTQICFAFRLQPGIKTTIINILYVWLKLSLVCHCYQKSEMNKHSDNFVIYCMSFLEILMWTSFWTLGQDLLSSPHSSQASV